MALTAGWNSSCSPLGTGFQSLVTAPGPRFAMLLLFYLVMRRPSSSLPGAVVAVGVLRTFAAGGWVYITSTDAHDWHDIFMITFVLCCCFPYVLHLTQSMVKVLGPYHSLDVWHFGPHPSFTTACLETSASAGWYIFRDYRPISILLHPAQGSPSPRWSVSALLSIL
jgi:Frag1/DRAM/Sfk1 family